MGTAGILCGRHCKDTLRLGTARILGGSAPQGYLAVRHCRDALRLGTAGILCGGALHEYSRQRAKTTLTLKSNNPTVRLGNKGNLSWEGFIQWFLHVLNYFDWILTYGDLGSPQNDGPPLFM